jgi:predicted nucleic acid-binding protein
VAISVPTLLLYETLNALKYSGVYDEKELEAAASSLSRYGFEVFQPTGELYRQTTHDSAKHDISVYDASYIALATRLKVPLFTADREILDKFPGKARHIRAFRE